VPVCARLIRTENGELVAYVYVDLEPGTDAASYVKLAEQGLAGEAHAEGTVLRLRPKLMTITTMAAGLLPLLWADGSGAEIMKRVAAPMLGGLVTSAFLTLEVIPVLYTIWRARQLRLAQRAESPVEAAFGRAPELR